MEYNFLFIINQKKDYINDIFGSLSELISTLSFTHIASAITDHCSSNHQASLSSHQG